MNNQKPKINDMTRRPPVNQRQNSYLPSHAAAREKVTDTKQDVNISISLSIPAPIAQKFKSFRSNIKRVTKIPRPNFRKIPSNRLFKPAIGLTALIIVATIGWQVFGGPKRPMTEDGVVQGAETKTLQFEPVVPLDKKEIDKKYDAQRKVITFKDQLAGVDIIISQQQLPETFKLDPQGSLDTFAKKINATTPIDAGETKASSGKSVNGPQTTVFQKNEKLVFIYSPKALQKDVLTAYIKILG